MPRDTFLPLLVSAFLLPASLAGPLRAVEQCGDPQPDGQVVEFLDRSVTFTDGYVTRMDVRVPAVSPGPCGWPTLVIVHSNRGNKGAVSDEAIRYAKRGYVTVTFDVRGQGPSMTLNNPLVYGRGAMGIRERLDLFEVMEEAEAQFPALIDFQRLGVTGPTQGGFFAWAAAAHSGRVPPANPWRTAQLPEVAAVAVHDFDVDLWQWLVPDGTNVSEMFVYNVFGDEPGLNVDPGYQALVEPFVLAEDYAGLRAALDTPQENLPQLLRTSVVPILATLSYDDMFGAATRTYEEWPQMVPGADKLLNLTTGGHRTPSNTRERALREHRETQWFDHHLRGIQNGVGQLDPYRFAIVPAERFRCLDEGFLWDDELTSAHPAIGTTPKRLYLAGGGGLAETAAQAGVGQESFTSKNASGYDIGDYLADLPNADEMLQKIPLKGIVYESQPLTEDLVAVGAGRAQLRIQTQDSDFLVHVSLFDVRPSGLSRYIAGGFRTVRNYGGGQSVLDVPLPVYGYRVKAGHSLRVRVENHAWHRPPMKTEGGPGSSPSFLRALPVFTEYTLRVRRDGAQGSYIELPIASPEAVRVGSALPKMIGSGPEDVRVAVHSDSRYAGWSFQVLAGLSGASPGFGWRGVQIPVNLDPLTNFIVGIGPSPPRGELRGTLDSDGRAEVTLGLGVLQTLPPAAAGLTLAAVIFDSQSGERVSAPLTLPVE